MDNVIMFKIKRKSLQGRILVGIERSICMNSITFSVLQKDKSYIIDLSYTTKFRRKGQTMYVGTVENLIDNFSKTEIKTIISIFENTKLYSKANIMKVSFAKATPKMKVVARSRLKKKLVENGIILIYRKKIMINPYILIPRIDKNIKDFQFLVQRAYLYLAEDKDAYYAGLNNFIDEIFK